MAIYGSMETFANDGNRWEQRASVPEVRNCAMFSLSTQPIVRETQAAFVGRHEELSLLRDRRRLACFVRGEAGIGKTRLLAEHRVNNERAFYAACLPGGADIPLDPLFAIVKDLARAGFVSQYDLGTLLAASGCERVSRLCETLDHASQRAPLTLQIDDIDGADSQTLLALDYCIERLNSRPLCWHLCARPGLTESDDLYDRLRRAHAANTIELEGLHGDDLACLIYALTPTHSWSSEELAEVEYLTGGSPLYAELLLARDVAFDAADGSALARALRKRLERFAPSSALLASWFAVASESLDVARLCQLSKLGSQRIDAEIVTLVDAGVLHKSPGGYAFRAGLLREMCYAALDESTRTLAHEAFAVTSVDDEERARHLIAAKRNDEAAVALSRVGWKRFEASDFSAAERAFERARACLESHLPEAVEALGGLAIVARIRGSWSSSAAMWAEFETCAESLSPQVRAAVRTRYAIASHESCPDLELIVVALEAACCEAATFAPTLAAEAWCALARVYERLGRHEAARSRLAFASAGYSLAPALTIRFERARLRCAERTETVMNTIGRLEVLGEMAHDADLATEFRACALDVCRLFEPEDAGSDRYAFQACAAIGLAVGEDAAMGAMLDVHRGAHAYASGRPREALALVTLAAARLDPFVVPEMSLAHAIGARASAVVDRFDDALAWARRFPFCDEDARASEARARTLGFVHELRGEPHEAFAAYRRAPNEPGALAGVARIACLLDRVDDARDAHERLRQLTGRDVASLRGALAESAGHIAISVGNIARGCAELASAADATNDRFHRATLHLKIATAKRDRRLFLEAIESFDALGSIRAAENARRIARRHGLRPGRMVSSPSALSERELTVAALVGNGKTNAEIGELLHITPRTAEFHVGNILAKCGLRSRVEIASRVALGKLQT